MDYVIINGVKSNTIKGLMIQSLPLISKPKIRTQIEEIDGIDGDIVTPLGYSAYDRTLKIGLRGDFNIDDVIQYFNSEGTVVFSNEPDKYYKFAIYEPIDFEKLIRFRQAEIVFHVQPFKHSDVEQPIGISPNLLSVPNYSNTSNGVNVIVQNSVISISGTATTNTEFYIPINLNKLSPSSYSLNASSWGTNSGTTSIRLIYTKPTNDDSFGNNYLNLTINQVVSLKDSILYSTQYSTQYSYLWIYIPKGAVMNFNISPSLVNTSKQNYNICNSGNIISRPTITLHGNGVSNIYVNGVQVFSVNFNDSITIDGEAMNAYRDGLLMNRSVTGNYDNLIFNVGNNVFSWDGDVTYISIDKYSRWI